MIDAAIKDKMEECRAVLQDPNSSLRASKYYIVRDITEPLKHTDNYSNCLDELLKIIADSTPLDFMNHYGELEQNSKKEYVFRSLNGIQTIGETAQAAFLKYLSIDYNSFLKKYDQDAELISSAAAKGQQLIRDQEEPQDLTSQELDSIISTVDSISVDDLMQAAAEYKFNYDFLGDAVENASADRLEGFLFPDTYQFYVGMQASSAINKFLDNFHNRVSDEMMQQASDMGMSMKEILTVASMIEKEAANDNERGLIASVIYNRLNSRIPLGIDATILYIHPEHEGAPTAAMLAEESLYNTRLNTGLPPTPICSPGLASIRAALNPNSTNYYFYALDTATGTHRFFTNNVDFDNFVATQNYG